VARAVCLSLASFCPSTGAAEDVLLLRPAPSASGAVRLVGEITDVNSRELRLRLASGSERRVPVDQVLSATTVRSTEAEAGDERFAAFDFAGALTHYRAALQPKGESRNWMRRSIVAQAIWCYRALDNDELAARTFIEVLLPSDPEGSQLDCVPLCWRPRPMTLSLERSAGEWLRNDKSPWTALIGASYMFGSRDQGSAIDRLKRLTSDSDRRVSWLAEAQLWRQSLVAESPERLVERLQSIDGCPEAYRAGPYYLVGAALLKKRPDDGALALLRLPILYPRERALAAASLLAAGQSLQERGQPQQAMRLYRELADRYPGSTEAGAATTRLSAGAGQP